MPLRQLLTAALLALGSASAARASPAASPGLCPHVADRVVEAEVTRLFPDGHRGSLVEARPVRVIKGEAVRGNVTFYLPGLWIDRPLPAPAGVIAGYQSSDEALPLRPGDRIVALLREAGGGVNVLSAPRDALFVRQFTVDGLVADAQGVKGIAILACHRPAVSSWDAPHWEEEEEEDFDEPFGWWTSDETCLEPPAGATETYGPDPMSWDAVVEAIASCAGRPPRLGEVPPPPVVHQKLVRDASFAARSHTHWHFLQLRLLRLAGADARGVNDRINGLYDLLTPASRGSDAVAWSVLADSQRDVLGLIRARPEWMSDPGIAKEMDLIEGALADYDRGYTDPWASFR